jgi:hypothetical protein
MLESRRTFLVDRNNKKIEKINKNLEEEVILVTGTRKVSFSQRNEHM